MVETAECVQDDLAHLLTSNTTLFLYGLGVVRFEEGYNTALRDPMTELLILVVPAIFTTRWVM